MTNEKNSQRYEGELDKSTTRPSLPPVKALLAFEAAAQYLNFTRAASELSVTPSAISHQIRSLEEFLGVALFARANGHIHLSDIGKQYADSVEGALMTIREATRNIAPQSQSDTVLILASPSVAANWLQPRLPQFHKLRPNARVRISTTNDWASITKTRFHIGISYGRPSIDDMVVRPLIKEWLRPMCSPKLASVLGLHRVTDLSRATLIHSTNQVSWDKFFRKLGLTNLNSNGGLWLDRSSMAIEAAVGGQGVILESDVLTEAEYKSGRLIAPIDGDAASLATTSYYMITPRGVRSRHDCAAFVDWLLSSIPPSNQP